jgi:diguanylate cyclase (GGDEF)-like protein
MQKTTDSLTGLVSAAELNTEMELLIEKADDFAYVIVDIDMLSVINRDFGREGGDAVFKCVARHLLAFFPAPCAVFRDTRDEFAILLPGCGKEESFLRAEEARGLIAADTLDFTAQDGRPLLQSVSMGIASFPDDGSRPAEIIRRGDSAVARAKKGGRNKVCLAREEKLLPKTSHYTAAQLEKLSNIAEKEKTGEAVLLREALDDLLRKYDK